MDQQRLFRMLFFVLIGIMMLYDLFFNSLSLLFSSSGTANLAAELGMSIEMAQLRAIVTGLLSALAGFGALLAAQTYINPAATRNGRIGVYLATAGLVGYGLFNIVSAVLWVSSDLRLSLMLTGGTYLFFAAALWYVGQDLRRI